MYEQLQCKIYLIGMAGFFVKNFDVKMNPSRALNTKAVKVTRFPLIGNSLQAVKKSMI
jgi:hypothetical protein